MLLFLLGTHVGGGNGWAMLEPCLRPPDHSVGSARRSTWLTPGALGLSSWATEQVHGHLAGLPVCLSLMNSDTCSCAYSPWAKAWLSFPANIVFSFKNKLFYNSFRLIEEL